MSTSQPDTKLTSLAPSQAYNSIFNADPNEPRLIGNFPLLPLRTKTRGPAYTLPFPNPPLPAHESPDAESESYDILDEVLALFRANTFFRNFELQGYADRLLVYGIWFVSDCLTKIKPTADVRTATKDVMNLALDLQFAIPGDPGWPLNQVRRDPSRQSIPTLALRRRAKGRGGQSKVRETEADMTSVDVRAPTRQARRRAAQAVYVPGAPGAGHEVTGARLRRPGRQAQQVVVELQQEEVHGQVAVRWINFGEY